MENGDNERETEVPTGVAVVPITRPAEQETMAAASDSHEGCFNLVQKDEGNSKAQRRSLLGKSTGKKRAFGDLSRARGNLERANESKAGKQAVGEVSSTLEEGEIIEEGCVDLPVGRRGEAESDSTGGGAEKEPAGGRQEEDVGMEDAEWSPTPKAAPTGARIEGDHQPLAAEASSHKVDEFVAHNEGMWNSKPMWL